MPCFKSFDSPNALVFLSSSYNHALGPCVLSVCLVCVSVLQTWQPSMTLEWQPSALKSRMASNRRSLHVDSHTCLLRPRH